MLERGALHELTLIRKLLEQIAIAVVPAQEVPTAKKPAPKKKKSTAKKKG